MKTFEYTEHEWAGHKWKTCKCPVCEEVYDANSIRVHIANKEDKAHKKFYKKHTKVIPTTRVVWDIS